MAEQYTSINTVFDRVKMHPMLQEVSFETMLDHTVNFLRLVGVPSMFHETTITIPLYKYRAVLPTDYYKITQLRSFDHPEIVYRYSTDNFHFSIQDPLNTDYTYKIQGNFIYTNNESGTLEMTYQAFALDDEGNPLIPDNSSFSRALADYIKVQEFTMLYDMGKLNGNILNHAEQQYAWSVGDCQSEFNRLSLDKAESFFNSWSTLLLRKNEHGRGFATNGSR